MAARHAADAVIFGFKAVSPFSGGASLHLSDYDIFPWFLRNILFTEEERMEAIIGGVVVGAVVAVAVPSIASGIGSVLRPLAKGMIKGGLVAYTAVSEMVAETGEQFNDMIAEAKAEIGNNDKKMTRAKPQRA
ncbi:MAG: DUF5132 domain-containing protein [Nitrospirota bacterium]